MGIAVIGAGFAKAAADDDNDPTGGLLRVGMVVGFYIAAACIFVSGLVWVGVARLVHLATIRQREWMADATAAQATGKPQSLAAALDHLREEDTALSGTGRLLQPLCIAGTPRHGRWWDDLSDTHPSIDRWIARLRGVVEGRQDRRVGAGLILPSLAAVATLVVAGFVTIGVLTGFSAGSGSTGSSAPVAAVADPGQQNVPGGAENTSQSGDQGSALPADAAQPNAVPPPPIGATATDQRNSPSRGGSSSTTPGPTSPPPDSPSPQGPNPQAGLAPRLVGSIPVSNPSGIALSHDGGRAYVAQLSGAISVIDTSTQVVTASIPVAGNPIAAAESPDGRRIFVSNWGDTNVSVIDTATNRVVATIPVGNVQWGIAMAPNGQRVYVALRGGGTVAVIDTATNTVIARIRTSATSSDNPVEVVVSPDGSHAYATNRGSATLAVINTDTNTLGGAIPVQGGPNGVAMTSDGQRLVVTNEGQGTISVIDASSRAVADIAVGNAPITAVLNGSIAHVVNRGSKTLSIVDTMTRNVTATINLGGDPGAIRLAPDGRRLYVTNSGLNAVTVLATSS